MAYSDFQALDAYDSKHAGAAIEIQLVDNSDGSYVVGAFQNHSPADSFEQVEIEESGNDGVDEHATGRHNMRGSVTAFYTPRWSDELPTRDNFIGRSFTLYEKVATGRPGEGTVLMAVVNVKITEVSHNQAPRGAKTINISYVATQRYSGQEWAALSGA